MPKIRLDRTAHLLASGLLASGLLAGLLPAVARADIVLSSNDGHTVVDDKGLLIGPPKPMPDTVSIIDVSHYPPTIKDTIEVPGSVVGPPMAVWVAPDERWAIVTSATKADPQGTNGISPDDRVSVIDLRASSPQIVQATTSGLGATMVRLSPDGTLALIANRAEGTVSIFTVKGQRLTPAGKLDTGNKASLPSSIVFLHDGKTALLTRSGDNMVNVLRIDGTNITIDPRPITTGLSPYTMDINAAGTLAAVSNMGRGDGDLDTVRLIELTKAPYHVVDTVAVPSGPEPQKFSPDGKFLAVGSQEGTTKPHSPFYREHGHIELFAVDGETLRKVAEAPIGKWAEGLAFSRDGRTIMAQSMYERTIEVFRWDGHHLTAGKPLVIKGAGPESFGTAWP